MKKCLLPAEVAGFKMSRIKNFEKIFRWILIIVVGIFIIAWFLVSKFSSPKSEIVTKNGLHWHSELDIKIFGQIQEIPANIGLGIAENPIHTHDTDNVIHMEFPGLVTKDDLKIGQFFKIWGKKFDKNCIFEECSGPDGKLKMLVNGKDSSEFENYMMQDGDKIEIIFEKGGNGAEVVKEITVVGTEFAFSPSAISVQAGEKVELIFKNEGRASHNLVIEGLEVSTKTIGGGQTDTVEFTAPASGTFTFFCSIPGHRASGMGGDLKIE